MAAGSWIVFNGAKLDLLDGSANYDGDVRIRLHTASWTPSLSATSIASTTWAANTNPANALDTYASGETSLTATGNNYRFDITATSVWTATGGSIIAKYASLQFHPTDGGELIAYCDLATGVATGVTVTSGNTLTISYPATGVFKISGATS